MGNDRVTAEDLHQVLEVEVSKMKTGSDWARWLDVAALFPSFGFGNVVLINLQMPQANWVARAHAWEKLGRRVVKQRGIRILEPIRSQTATGDNNPAADGRVHHDIIGFRVATVYDVTDTAGPPIYLPRTSVPGSRDVSNHLWSALAQEVSAEGFTIDVRPIGDASEGFTDYDAKQIVIADHLDDFTAVARLAHEVGHMRMHSGGDVSGAGSVMCRGAREVEAESIAYIVLAHNGLSVEATSFDYVAGWATLVDPDDPGSVIKATGARVVNAARQLIDSTDKYLQASRTPLPTVPARPLDSLFLPPDVDGPAL
ncbi:ImmA/IrrE family metallo-endopeptidase (plasmid) [Kribbella sp. CWNU-51]